LDFAGHRHSFFAIDSDNSAQDDDGPNGQFKGLVYENNSRVVGYIGLEVNPTSSGLKIIMQGTSYPYTWEFAKTRIPGPERICDQDCPAGQVFRDQKCQDDICSDPKDQNLSAINSKQIFFQSKKNFPIGELNNSADRIVALGPDHGDMTSEDKWVLIEEPGQEVYSKVYMHKLTINTRDKHLELETHVQEVNSQSPQH
jgi:hypothetical protein